MLSTHRLTCGVMLALLLSPSTYSATIDTVAGTGSEQNSGDVGLATEVNVGDPFGVEIGPDGALYVTEVGHHRVRRVDLTSRRITTVAGTGVKGYSGDGGPATRAKLNEPYEVRFDAAGNMFFVEMKNHVIRRVDRASGVIRTIAGTGAAGFSGDGGPATRATLRQPHSIALDGRQGLYVADIGNHRIRHVDLKTENIRTIAGTGEKRMPVHGQSALGRAILGPRALAIVDGTMWIALREGNSIWKMDLETYVLSHVAGSGDKGFRNGEPASATFNGPKGIAVDSDGNIFVVDTENHVVRKVDATTRSVSTSVGSGRRGGRGDGKDPLHSEMDRPHGICIGTDGSLFIGDTLNHRVRVVR